MMTLDKQQLDDGVGVLIKSANTDILAECNDLAQAINSDGDNDMKDKLLEACNKYQRVYNESFKPSVDKVIASFRGTYDIAELMEKADVGDIKTTDASFSTKAVDPASVRL